MDTLTANALAAALQEPKKALLTKVLRTIGPERYAAIFAETLTIEANRGLLVQAGDRRRTPGGTFFHLVRQQCTRQERARLFPNKPATPPMSTRGRQPSRHRPRCATTGPGAFDHRPLERTDAHGCDGDLKAGAARVAREP
jgi:hypothetical protein